MRFKHQKIIIVFALISIFGAYFWYLFDKEQPTFVSSTSSESKTPDVPLRYEQANPETSHQKKVKDTTTPQDEPTLPIEQIDLIDINELNIDEFRDLSQIFDELAIPPAVILLIKNGDLLGASSILLSEPNNPKFHLALELMTITCSAMSYEEKFLATEVSQEEKGSQILTKQEKSFFDELSKRRLAQTQFFNQSCDDFKRAEVIDIEQKRNTLLSTNESPLAQLVSQMSTLKQNDIIRLMREAHDQQPTRFTHKNLAAILLTSENENDLNQGIELFLSLNNPEPDIIQTVVHCLENQCREIQHNLGELDTWLKKGAEYGSPKAIQKLSDRLILDEQPEQALAWQEFEFALLKLGCYKSINNYEQTYTRTKSELNGLKANLTEEQISQAMAAANRQFDDFSAQSKRWLQCE
ncbi:MAG: hypothetical protein HWE27_12395 [Gammaproteobacteria bacterium]|nr:hypothetical protein [Gammaproteobacteria bacterium]